MSKAASSAEILSRIEARLGFVPPFFAPAVDNPVLLANLWQQTESAYLDSPLPGLFKEKLAALLGRYCEVAYCLMCHTCSLRPLGMQGPAILKLLTSTPPSDEDITQALRGMDELADNVAFPIAAKTEDLLFCLASAIYFAGPLASSARECLRKRLTVRDYQSLIVLTTYNKMCHEWMAAHPDVSYTLDQRYVQNWEPISKEAPAIVDVFASRSLVAPTRDFETVAAQRAAETERSAQISEQRFDEVLRALNERVTAATRETSEQEELATELRRTSAFAQDLLAIVSHDLRNPLNTIEIGVTLALECLGPTHEVARPLQRVIASSRRAERLVHDLLDFSLARAGGGIPIRLQPMDLHELARAAADEFLGAHPGIVLRVTGVGSGAGEWDSDRMRQVLGNLLTNARAHGRDLSTIELSARVDAEVAQISVHNENASGPISDEMLPVLFDPFKRGVVRRFSRTRSVGLGLYIVDQIVRAHRGRITVVSNGETTAFTITVPRAATSPTQAAETGPGS